MNNTIQYNRRELRKISCSARTITLNEPYKLIIHLALGHYGTWCEVFLLLEQGEQ